MDDSAQKKWIFDPASLRPKVYPYDLNTKRSSYHGSPIPFFEEDFERVSTIPNGLADRPCSWEEQGRGHPKWATRSDFRGMR
ncbi:hypothetical protein Sinac_5519 [Singulisphaera acidiphila DSM 18658]|uniref:Uncharacterized protein n=1 Tax=Singulisphaera acidiphila (strain ATCC BAA-1392 / DSM 18658 / VKM B-2454 / MOB10) TaxID=886293 RepID=L0DLF4_SINAD|nr:hypothetical protein Sinac_5519 [Singulisphaera acidiphila DSM 18658]